MTDKTIIKIKEDPIIIRMTGKGVPGRTGPAGAKGDDGIVWTLSLTMTDTPDGQCTMRLYKDGVLCTQESHYAYVQVLAYYHGSIWTESSYSEVITGTVTFTYTNVKAFFVTIYEDSFREKILCANTINCGRNDWTVVPVMATSPDGTCTITLYKDGAVYNKACYAEVRTLAYYASNYVLSSSYSGNFTGTKTFTYTNTRGVFVSVYTNSQKTDFLCSECVNYGQSATIAVGTVKQGATATVTNVGTPLNATFDFTLPKGDQGEVSVAETETLPAGSPAYVQDLLPNDPNRARLKFGIPNGGGSGARVEGRTLILDAGAIFTPEMSDTGVLSWTNNASLNNPESKQITVNPRGTWSDSVKYARMDVVIQNGSSYIAIKTVPAGTAVTNTSYWMKLVSKGDTGTITVGTVTGLTAGTKPTVSNVGTSTDAVLNFGIPQAAKVTIDTPTALNPGATPTVSNTGTEYAPKLKFGLPKSSTVDIGTVTQLDPGATPTVSNSGTKYEASFDFGLPKSSTVNVGTVTGLNPGSTPTVTNVGSQYEARLNFGLPKSPTVTVGTVTPLTPGSTPTVSNAGTQYEAKLNFGLPKSATISVGTVATGASGTNASVTNSGTENNAVLDFVIPRGQDGDGYMGAQYDEPEEGVIFEVAENMLSDMAFEDDAQANNKEYVRKNGSWVESNISADYDSTTECLTLTI